MGAEPGLLFLLLLVALLGVFLFLRLICLVPVFFLVRALARFLAFGWTLVFFFLIGRFFFLFLILSFPAMRPETMHESTNGLRQSTRLVGFFRRLSRFALWLIATRFRICRY